MRIDKHFDAVIYAAKINFDLKQGDLQSLSTVMISNAKSATDLNISFSKASAVNKAIDFQH